MAVIGKPSDAFLSELGVQKLRASQAVDHAAALLEPCLKDPARLTSSTVSVVINLLQERSSVTEALHLRPLQRCSIGEALALTPQPLVGSQVFGMSSELWVLLSWGPPVVPTIPAARDFYDNDFTAEASKWAMDIHELTDQYWEAVVDEDTEGREANAHQLAQYIVNARAEALQVCAVSDVIATYISMPLALEKSAARLVLGHVPDFLDPLASAQRELRLLQTPNRADGMGTDDIGLS